MIKIFTNKIDLPYTKQNLSSILVEGKNGFERQVSDSQIANWCYEFYLSYSDYADEGRGICSTDRAKSVALEVSSQWEADLENSNGRVLSAELFSEWLMKLGVKNA